MNHGKRRDIRYDVLVIGDEVESVLTAVSAARAGASVFLARRSAGRLGGLSVRGGLSYMDITPECVAGLFREFLQRAGVVRVALNPDRAHAVLRDMLAESHVRVFSATEAQVTINTDGLPQTVSLHPVNPTPLSIHPDFEPLSAPLETRPKVLIDATPDADIARALGVPFIVGLGGLFGEQRNFLGISPVFRITGVPVPALQTFEKSLREQTGMADILKQALPWHPPSLRVEYLNRPTFAPGDMDYLDILNPIIGIDYHIWRHGDPASYPEADILIDGGNVSRLENDVLGFNGLVADPQALNLDLQDLLALSQGAPVPEPLRREMRFVEQYLCERGGFREAHVEPPEEMYIRQTVTLLSRNNLTARKALEGGTAPEKSIGSFSYWLDLRGLPLWKYFPGEHLPKPFFNIGLDVALPPDQTRLKNIAFIGRSAGYSPIGQGAGRIVQHNALLGEGVGIAAALAVRDDRQLHEIADAAMPRIQEILKHRRDGELRCDGYSTASPDQLNASRLLLRDAAIVESIQPV